jgi:hypothetical protein
MLDNKNLKKCGACGADMAKSAKACPSCGAKNKKPIFTKWWFWLAAVLIIVLIAVPKSGGDRPASSDSPPGDESTAQSYTAVTATELIIAYEANEVAADRSYKGKWLAVTGTVESIGTSGSKTFVRLSNDEDSWSLTDTQCFIAAESIDAVAELVKGDTVTFLGKCNGLGLFDVEVTDCILDS